MKTYNVSFFGRKVGAIGTTYRTPPVRVEAERPADAIEKAREENYRRGFEHLHCEWCDELPA